MASKGRSIKLTVHMNIVNYINTKHHSNSTKYNFAGHGNCKYNHEINIQHKSNYSPIRPDNKLYRGPAALAAGPHPGTPPWKKIKIDASVCSLSCRSHYLIKKGALQNNVDW